MNNPVIISPSFLLIILRILDKFGRLNQNTFYIKYFFPENRADCKIMWKNIIEPDIPQMNI